MRLFTQSSPRRLRARTLAASAAAILAVFVAATATRASARASAASTPRCTTPGLVVWLDTNGNGTLGHVFFNLEFTNLSGHACTLRGFPGVSGVNLAGRRLGLPAVRDASTPVHTIHLAKGQTVSAVVGITDVGVFPPAVCGPTMAAGLRVFPPNATVSKVVPFPFGACSRTGTSYLSIRAVH